MDTHYGGVIWTNHAIERMRARGIKQGDAWATWNRPEQSYKANLHGSGDAWRYYRTWGDQKIEVVAKQNERHEWVIISVWADRVYKKENQVKGKSFWRILYNFVFGR